LVGKKPTELISLSHFFDLQLFVIIHYLKNWRIH